MCISNFIAWVVTNVLLIVNAIVRGIISCIVIGSFSASLKLKIKRVVPVSNISGTVNPCVQIGK